MNYITVRNIHSCLIAFVAQILKLTNPLAFSVINLVCVLASVCSEYDPVPQKGR